MLAHGRVENGVVVFPSGTRLSEGLEVTVMTAHAPSDVQKPHSVLDIPTVSLGAILEPFESDDDLLANVGWPFVIRGMDTGFLVAVEVVEHADHLAARQTLSNCIAANDRIALAPQVLAEFVHVVTDPRRFQTP